MRLTDEREQRCSGAGMTHAVGAECGMVGRWLLAVWRQTQGMTEVRPAANPDAAQWLLRSDVDSWDLVRYGPPGFDVYVRVAFAQDPAEGEDPALRLALAT